jgi:hypothetical protein
MTLISTITVGSGGASNIEFTSIPQTYTDLQILLSCRTAQAAITDDIYMILSGDVTTSYSGRILAGDGTSGSSFSYSASGGAFSGPVAGASATSNTFGNSLITIPNYAGSTNKSISYDAVTETNGTLGRQQIAANLFAKTTAVTSVKFITAASANFVQHSSISIYGITKGSGGATVS